MHPYSQQPDASFWRRFVSDTAWSDVDFVGTPKFTLSPEDKVSMAGSCFTQHIARHMRKRGLTQYQTDSAHPLSREAGVQDTSFDMFSARFGNVYTSPQCLELLQQAVGLRPIVIEDFVTQDGRVYDLLRPNTIPGGFAALEEAQADRQFHMARVRDMFEGADVLVYTLGLTESWCHRQGAYTYPVCPGTARGLFDPQQHQFHNLTQAQVVADLVALVELAGQINPGLKFIFTVSPVPLVATHTQQNVLLASSYSKSVLRAACGEVAHIPQDLMHLNGPYILDAFKYTALSFWAPWSDASRRRVVYPKAGQFVEADIESSRCITSIGVESMLSALDAIAL